MSTSTAAIVPHGTLDYLEMRALGLQPEELTLFSSNINPFGPPPAVISAMAAASSETIARYPDRLSLELRELLAVKHRVAMDSVLVGNGSADLMWLIGLLHLQRRRVAILEPTFGEYRNVANIMQAEAINICHPGWIATTDGYAPGKRSLDDVAAEVRATNADAVFICNPNNPTGHQFTHEELATLYDALPHALWIIDEAYAEFMQPPATTESWVDRGNWLILRSMTKDYALGGLRLGYLLGAPEIIQPLQAAQPPWNVNTFAQLAGCVSLREGQEWRIETLERLATETAHLQDRLRHLGFRPLPTTVSYFLVPVESPSTMRSALLAQRLVIRDCTSFGLPHFIRIATQLPEANARLVDALADFAPAT